MPIRVKVLYFGQARDAAEVAEEDVSLPNRSSVAFLVTRSTTVHGRLQRISAAMRIAVNEEISKGDQTLADGDVVAFLPPVAGG